MKNNLSTFLFNLVLDSPFFRRAMSSLEHAINLYNRCKNDAEYTFSVVAMDHATTLILLDKLESEEGKIYEKYGYVINFYDSIKELIHHKNILIPENKVLGSIHLVRDGILHKGEIVPKADSRYYLEKTLEFFDYFLTKVYNKRLPKFIISNANLYKKNSQLNKTKTPKQLLSIKKISSKNPIRVFYHNYDSVYTLINLLGYENKILKKGTQFNFKNLKDFKKLDFVSSNDYKSLSQSMMMHERISIGGLDQNLIEIKKLNNFLEKFTKKLKKHSPSSLSKQVEELNIGSLINLLNQSESNPKRVKRKDGK